MGRPAMSLDEAEGVVRERLLRRSEPTAGGCREWRGAVNPVSGYGQTSVPSALVGVVSPSRGTYAHVVACYLRHGKRPSGNIDALHACDNKLCVNGDHLSWGHRSKNTQDAWDRGLIHATYAKLTDAQVIEIATQHLDLNVEDVGAMFSVSPSLVSRYRKRKGRAARLCPVQEACAKAWADGR